MKSTSVLKVVPLLLLLVVWGPALRAEDMVTIPKSRLQELERKEAELEKLKGELPKAKAENAQLKKQHEEDVVKINTAPAPAPAVVHASPPLASLPPLKENEVVEAMDLANYSLADARAADQRFGKRSLHVQGEVERFQKPLFTRDYKIVLKTADRKTSVVCTVFPPEKYRAVFTVNNGAELVGLTADETRVPLACVGGTVVVAGRCMGLSGSVISIGGGELKSAR